MKHGLYAIRDNVAQLLLGGAYALQIHQHPATAVRMFTDVFNDTKSIVHAHPADFALVQIGEINIDTGELINFLNGPETVITATALAAAQAEPLQLAK